MDAASVCGRFAPSPTGDIHLGTARTSLVAWLHARARGGRLLLRIEDLDAPRVVAGTAERIMEDLLWLGLDWDGPPVWQSQRRDLYRLALGRLDAGGWLYPCFCSRAELVRAASAPHPGDEGPSYLGTCRARVTAGTAQVRPPALRFRCDGPPVTFVDLLYGTFTQDVAHVTGDFVVCRGDGIPAYQLAVVVDDAEMGITHVVRGADLLASTPRQLLLCRALGISEPQYLHVPLVLGPGGERLAKRHRSLSLRSLRENGRDPQEITGILASTLGLCAPGVRTTPADLIGSFDVGRLPREPLFLDQDSV